MSRILADALRQWLAVGRNLVGEIRISEENGKFFLRHHLDLAEENFPVFTDPEKAIELGKYDAAGKYRPLRTAPTLKRGWQLQLKTHQEIVQALDFFYPAMLGTALAFDSGRGQPVNLRDTLNRQTGMYRVAGKITNAQADILVGEACAAKICLKTNTWKIDSNYPITKLPSAKLHLEHDTLQRADGFIPLPCEECCNILVAAARETVKKAVPPPST